MISRRLIDVGVGRGHDIRVSSVRPKKKALHASPNLTLLIDVFNFAHSIKSLGAWREFEPRFLESMIERAPFVHLTQRVRRCLQLALSAVLRRAS